jgi:hypothetical protein
VSGAVWASGAGYGAKRLTWRLRQRGFRRIMEEHWSGTCCTARTRPLPTEESMPELRLDSHGQRQEPLAPESSGPFRPIFPDGFPRGRPPVVENCGRCLDAWAGTRTRKPVAEDFKGFRGRCPAASALRPALRSGYSRAKSSRSGSNTCRWYRLATFRSARSDDTSTRSGSGSAPAT